MSRGSVLGIKALAFDLQGTSVDFHQPVMRMGAGVNAAKGLSIDWERFARDWRGLYRAAMDDVVAGARPWLSVDRIYREALDELLNREGLSAHFAEHERAEINDVWTRLEAWPDSIAGLARLRACFTLAALSNARMASVIAVVKHAALPFDAILSAELARSYKPAPAVYQLAVDYLGVPAASILMVACHAYDLEAARAFGMRTAFVRRPLEFGPGSVVTPPDRPCDIHALDFLDLADQLGA